MNETHMCEMCSIQCKMVSSDFKYKLDMRKEVRERDVRGDTKGQPVSHSGLRGESENLNQTLEEGSGRQ